MADANTINLTGSIPPEMMAEQQQLNRQQQLAQLLLQQGQQQPQGQMVSGHYVAPSFFQYAAPLASTYVGLQKQKEFDQKSIDLANKLRQQNAEEAQGIIGALTGTPAQTIYGAGEEGPTKTVTPAIPANPQLALNRALNAQGTIGQTMLPSIMKQVMPEEFTLGEGQIRYKQMPDGTTQVLGKGGEKLHAVGDNLVTSDGKVVYQGQTAGHILETPNGVILVNPKSGAQTPLYDKSGQPLQGNKGLTEAEGKATNYGMSMANATKEMKALEAKGFNPASLAAQSGLSASGTTLGNIAASPQTQQYKQAMDNFANAYLRFQSGANMSEQEIQRNLKNMMPAIGDSSAQLAQKARARDIAMQGITIAAGPQGARNIPQNVSAAAPIIPSVVNKAPATNFDPKLLDFMTPEQRALFGGK